MFNALGNKIGEKENERLKAFDQKTNARYKTS